MGKTFVLQKIPPRWALQPLSCKYLDLKLYSSDIGVCLGVRAIVWNNLSFVLGRICLVSSLMVRFYIWLTCISALLIIYPSVATWSSSPRHTFAHGKIRKSLGPHNLLCQNHRVWMPLIVTSQLLRVKSQFLLVKSPFSMVQPWFNHGSTLHFSLSPTFPNSLRPSRTVGPRTQRPRRHSAQGAGARGAGDGAARLGGWGRTPSKTCGVKPMKHAGSLMLRIGTWHIHHENWWKLNKSGNWGRFFHVFLRTRSNYGEVKNYCNNNDISGEYQGWAVPEDPALFSKPSLCKAWC